MNTQQINFAVEKIPLLKKKFQGVWPIDKIPQNPKTGYYIINLDPSHKKGSHWVSVKITSRGKNIFFDSYGFPPQKGEIKSFVGKKYEFNRKRLQNIFSTTCGQWCLFFIYFAHKKFTLKEMFKHFSHKHLYANDFFVNETIRDIFETKTAVVDKKFLFNQISRSLKRNIKCCEYYCKINAKKCIF